MDEKKETTLNNAHDALFESHGMAKRNSVFFTLIGIVWLGAAVFHLACFWNGFKERESYAKQPPHAAMEGGGMEFSRKRPVSGRQMFTELFLCCSTGGIGILSIAAVVQGRKLYMKIYESHVEGYAGFSLMTEEIRMPISRVFYISSHAQKVMPFAEVYTASGMRVSFFMSAKKAEEAERVFREHILEEGEKVGSLPDWPGI